MVCRCPTNDYNKFIAGVFGECISGTGGVTSFIFGWISIAFGFFSYYPQIRMNFLLKRSEAMSVALLVCWIAGDLFNIISCYILDQLFTQKLMSVVFVFFDVIMIFQHFYYLQPKNQGVSKPTTFTTVEKFIYAFIAVVLVNNILWSGFFNSFGLDVQEQKYPMCPTSPELDKSSVKYIVGNVMAYLSIPCYLASRPGQIIKNFKRKTAVGLSVGMFAIISSANMAQMISYVTMSQEKSYIMQKVPYILSAVLPSLCDMFVIGQWVVYTKMDKVKEINMRKEQRKSIEVSKQDTEEQTLEVPLNEVETCAETCAISVASTQNLEGFL
ncbi:Seven_transmembrane protein 1 [Hexamita inflata]|uniref:Seven transmembrane protein 1 n=1 Tax=Hexamita inflata TaxID=28002 RepID=A0AA86PPT0_9EUKA|nr:Seven transmembrane protein 1 [Hexamita inflata]